ncbi:hypothetical protein QFZ44_000809 [Pantoea agglomerans]|nr:hypothetical protein [Pantoea agglomerans]
MKCTLQHCLSRVFIVIEFFKMQFKLLGVVGFHNCNYLISMINAFKLDRIFVFLAAQCVSR